MVRTTIPAGRRGGRAPVVRRRTLPDLPSELVEDIISRLPEKTVGVLRCTLSKAWCTRLSTSAFVKAHFRFHLNNPGDASDSGNNNIIFENNNGALPVIGDRRYNINGHYHLGYFPANGRDIKLVTSPLFRKSGDAYVEAAFNGLVLVSFKTKRKHEKKLFLFNPITSDALRLFTFQSTHTYGFGFGYDISTDDYKIVRLLDSKDKGTIVYVYSLKSKCWRNLGVSRYCIGGSDNGRGVYLNNCIHWLGMGKTRYDPRIIVAFDLAKEEFYKVPSPKIVNPKSNESANDDGSDHSSDDEDSDHSSDDEGSDHSSDHSSDDEGSDDSSDHSSDDEGSDDSSEEDYEEGFEECDCSEYLSSGDDVHVFGGCLAVVKSDDIHERITIWVMREYGDEESWERHVIRTDYGYYQFVCVSNEDKAIFRRNTSHGVEFCAYNMLTREWNDVPGLRDLDEVYDGPSVGAVPFRECHLYPNFV